MKLKILLIPLLIVGAGLGTYFIYTRFVHDPFNTQSQEDVLGSSSQDTTVYPPDGYSYNSVSTKVGKFGAYVYKASLAKVTVKTVAANKETCKSNCPVKNLKQYAVENYAIAAMNGTYFCPPDYPSCKSKLNSFDFAFYNSNKGVWLNKNALTWFKTAIMTFRGKTAKVCLDTTKCGTSGVTAAISNYPALVQDGQIVVEKGDVQDYQRKKGMKGAIGTDGNNVYLVLIPNTTITEAAYTVRAMGITGALNIDGGGSSAMYVNGAYKIGPGRLLPNAIVITK